MISTNEAFICQVMPVLLLLPILTIILSMILLGERPSPIVIIGGAIVLAGLAIINFAPTQAVPLEQPAA